MTTNLKVSNIALKLITFISVVFIVYMLQDFLIPLLFAIILSVLIYPIVRFLEKRLCFNRIIAITIGITVFTSIIFSIFVLIGIQFNEIMDKSDTYIAKIESKVNAIITQTEKSTGLKSEDLMGERELKVEEVVKKNSNKILDFIMASGSVIGDFILIPLYMFFFLLYRNFLLSFMYRVTAQFSSKSKSRVVFRQLYKVQQNYMVGLSLVMFIVGLLNSVGLLLLGIDFPFFFGFLCALLLLVPYIGIIIGSLLPALIALATKDSYWYAIGVIAIFGFIQFLEGNIITPKITGSKVSLNSFASILVIVLFSMLWGIPGMILALPITASLKVVFDNTENYKHFGFLLGEADDKYFSSRSRNRLKIWKQIRKLKNKRQAT